MPEPSIIAVDCTASDASVALGVEGAVVFEKAVAAGRKPSEVLMTPLGEALACIPESERLGAVVVGTGPGSYNGARVAIAAAQGIGLVRECAVAGISSLEALKTIRTGERCLAVGDARRGTMFVVRLGGGRIVGEVELVEPADLVGRVEVAVEEGHGVVTLEEPGRLLLPGVLEQEVRREEPEARLLLEAWDSRSEEEREKLAAVPPEPFYLREAYITTPRSKGGGR